MKIGYACINIGPADTRCRTCRKESATPEKLAALVSYNLSALEKIIDYNIASRIGLFRISSDLIPFGSSDINPLEWWGLFHDEFTRIGDKIRQSGMRVSMHPGQYTVLNSPDDGIAMRAAEDLVYHARVLDALGTDSSAKIILHIGGVYGDKSEASTRFAARYQELPADVRSRLVIENDDKLYHIGDVLAIGEANAIPVVFDNLHNIVNPFDAGIPDSEWIRRCAKTWNPSDGNAKIHYSQQSPSKRTGAHSESIAIDEFMGFIDSLDAQKPDIMLEVKDKNISAVKCCICTSPATRTKHLEEEWSLYKYKVLEQSPAAYLAIREILKDKKGCPARDFYRTIESALKAQTTKANILTAAQHVWGYFKDQATPAEKKRFFKALDGFYTDGAKPERFRNILHALAKKYDEEYLLKSYYFYI
ncbi:MAG: UV DNA damage repair endonuclease UvsE [Saccharofermentanales bacterium]